MILHSGFLNAVTGWNHTIEGYYKIGERVANLRHAFNLREGINPLDWKMHSRIIGEAPYTLKEGPHAGVTVDLEAMINRNLDALGVLFEIDRIRHFYDGRHPHE